MKIVGVSRICNEFVEEIDLTIGSMAAFCDEVCFVFDHVKEKKVLDAVDRCSNLVAIDQYPDVLWGHYESWDQAYHLANRFDPDWIIIQDQDEVLPYVHIPEAIAFAEVTECDTIVFPAVNCWETPTRIVWPKLSTTGDHCRMFKGGNADFSIHGGGGCCSPSSPHKCYYCQYPYRHMGQMTASCRERRKDLLWYRNKREKWSENEPPTFPYRGDWTMKEWRELDV